MNRRVLAVALAVVVAAGTLLTIANSINAISDRVGLRLSREFFDRFGDGYVNVVFVSPYRVKAFKFRVSDFVGRVVEVDVGDVVNDFVDQFKKINISRDPHVVPSISITMYFYRDGKECIANYIYTTVDFFMDRGYSEEDAVKKAEEDPLAMFRRGLLTKPVIEFRPRMPRGSLEPLCTDFSQAIDEFIKRIGGDRNPLEFVNSSVAGLIMDGSSEPQLSILPVAEVKAQTSYFGCILSATQVVWQPLYDSRGSPPRGWLANISSSHPYITDDVKRAMWRWYATNFSKAYYYEVTPNCDTAGKAVDETMTRIYWSTPYRSNILYLTAPGVIKMDDWIAALATSITGFQFLQLQSGLQLIDWKDYKDHLGTQYIDKTLRAPYMGVMWVNPKNKPLTAGIAIATASKKESHKGLAFMGVIIFGESQIQETPPKVFTTSCGGTYCVRYLTLKTTFRYVGDVMAIQYDVEKVSINGKYYWRVRPITAILPGVSVIIDYSSGSSIGAGLADPSALQEVSYALHELTYNVSYRSYNRYLTNVPGGSVVFVDTNNINMSNSLSSGVWNVVLSLALATISTLGPQNALASLMLDIVGGFFSIAYEDLYNVYIAYALEVSVSQPFVTIDSLYISVTKQTLAYTVAEYQNFAPLLVMYHIYVV